LGLLVQGEVNIGLVVVVVDLLRVPRVVEKVVVQEDLMLVVVKVKIAQNLMQLIGHLQTDFQILVEGVQELLVLLVQVVLVVPVSSLSPTQHKYLKTHNGIYKGHQ
jgi:hypothetical protein